MVQENAHIARIIRSNVWECCLLPAFGPSTGYIGLKERIVPGRVFKAAGLDSTELERIFRTRPHETCILSVHWYSWFRFARLAKKTIRVFRVSDNWEGEAHALFVVEIRPDMGYQIGEEFLHAIGLRMEKVTDDIEIALKNLRSDA